jgi:hypothetical protein
MQKENRANVDYSTLFVSDLYAYTIDRSLLSKYENSPERWKWKVIIHEYALVTRFTRSERPFGF